MKVWSFIITLAVHFLLATQLLLPDQLVFLFGIMIAGIVIGAVIRFRIKADAERKLGWGIMTGSITGLILLLIFVLILFILLGGHC